MAGQPIADAHQQLGAIIRAGTLGGLPDGALLERFVAGADPAASLAFAVLIRRHGPMVLHTCRRVLDNRHDAEDAAQAAFLVLARRARAIRRHDSVGSWLFGVAVRVARRARARDARRRRIERAGGEMAARANGANPGAAGPGGEPRWADLYRELGRLPEPLRAPLVLCYLEGLSNERAAEQLGTSLRTLRRRLAEGRERLGARLAARGVAPAAALLGSALADDPASAATIASAWADRTVLAALEFATPGGGAAGAASAAAVALAQEVLRSMFRAKLGLALATTLLAGTAALAGLLAPAQDDPPGPAGPGPTRPALAGLAPPRQDRPPLPEFVTARPRTGPGRTTRIQIVAADTGAPVPHANVRVWAALDDDWRTADAEGRIAVAHSTGPADTSFSVDVWGDGHAMQRHRYGERDGAIPEDVTIKLQPGETLGGIVQDEQGRPVAGATVYLWSHNYKRKDPTELLFDLRATTGPDGRWKTGGAPETTGDLLGFYITHPDYLSDREYVAGRARPPIAELRAGTAVSVMTTGTAIEGRVVDADGRPVAGALVCSTDQPNTLFGSVRDFAVASDAEGRFRTGQVKRGEWHLVVQARGHAPAAAVVKVAATAPPVEVRLGPAKPLRLRVLDPKGRPIPGAFLNVDTWGRYRCLGIFLWTDAEGRAHWDDAPGEGRLLISGSLAGYLGEFQKAITPTDEETTLTFRPALQILGTVRDAETNKRIKQAAIEYGAVDPATGEVAQWTAMPGTGYGAKVYDGDLSPQIPIEADAYKIRVVAQGYEPFVSRLFRAEERVVYDYGIKLSPPAPGGPRATVSLADDVPLANARVVIGQINDRNIGLKDGGFGPEDGGSRDLRTDQDGSFPIPPLAPGSMIFVVGEQGYAYATEQELQKAPRMRAQPFARVEGRYLIGDRPGANLPIQLSGLYQAPETNHIMVSSTHETTTDAEGRFEFERVIALPELRIARDDPRDRPGRLWTNGDLVPVAPGETTRVVYGGSGRPVLGRVVAPAGRAEPVDFAEKAQAYLISNKAPTPYPPELFRGKLGLNDGAWSEWSQRWRYGPGGRAHSAGFHQYAVDFAADGSFRIDDVPPGEYRLVARVGEREFGGEPGPFAAISRTVVVPPDAGPPIDLGPLALEPRTSLEVGRPAPDVEVTTIAGKRVAIPGDFRGRYLLLDFGAPYTDQCRLQIARVNGIRAGFGEDRLAILSLIVAADTAETRQFVAAKGQSWPQAILGPFPNPIPRAFGIEDSTFGVGNANLPLLILVGPDGRVLARDIYGREIEKKLAEIFGQ